MSSTSSISSTYSMSSSSPSAAISSANLDISLSLCTITSSWVMLCSLLLSLLSSCQRMSFSSVSPIFATDEMNTTGRSSGNVSRSISISSSSSKSHFVTARTLCLSSMSGLKFRSSLSSISYSFLMSSVSPGTIKSNRELRSIWRRNRSPSPLPSLAPSIIPGMSAMTNDLWSRYATIPREGSRVVKG